MMMYLQLPALLVVVSLVYAATRFDEWPDILGEAVRWGSRMAAFMIGIFVVMVVLAILCGQ